MNYTTFLSSFHFVLKIDSENNNTNGITKIGCYNFIYKNKLSMDSVAKEDSRINTNQHR